MVHLLAKYQNLDSRQFQATLTSLRQTAHPDNRRTGQPARPHSASRRLTDAQRDEIVRRYVAGETAVLLGREFHVGRNMVLNLLDGAGVPRQVRRVSDAEVKEILTLHREGHTILEITMRVGRASGSVWNVIHRND